MLFSSNLLRRYINVKDDAKNIANYLTLKTCEIEEIIKREIPQEVVIAYVLKCEKHPDADKLFVTQVDCWEKWIFQIVTWAENIKKDIYVPVALDWAYLKAKDLKIKPVNMRWFESNGMICSKEELWINEDLDLHGIWILDDDVNTLSKNDLWKALSHELPFLNNFIFDIDNKTLTNRPDLTWHLGQAIEIHAIYKLFGKEKIYLNDILNIFESFQNTNIFEALENAKEWNQRIQAKTDLLRSYLTLELNDINLEKTNFETRLSLIDLWEKSINNFVDFSNIFMLLTWQPIHFFDADKISGDIIIETAVGGEIFVDLMDKEHTLEKGDILIKDEEKILALAGVVWGKSSQITENTKNIIVEFWNFDPIQIRKTWNAHDLRTNAKIRFEKNINPLFTMYSLFLFLDQLKISWIQAKTWWINYYYDESIKQLFNKYLSLDFAKISQLTWIDDISQDQMMNILTCLWFTFRENQIKVPYRRSPADINIQEDIFEEIVRIYGFENIPWKKIKNQMLYIDFNHQTELVRLVERVFVEQNHFNLIETYPWFDANIAWKLVKLDTDNLYSLQNPTAPENKYLRDNLYLNLIAVLWKNFRNYENMKIFETWKVFNLKDWEKLVLWAVLYKKVIKNWKDSNIFEFKQILNKILKQYWVNWLVEFDKNNCEFENISHPKQFANILLNKQKIWGLFTLHPYHHKDFKFSESAQITFLEIDLDKLIHIKSQQKSKAISALNYFTQEDQIVERDLSFVISKNDDYSKIISPISKLKQVIDFEIFDIYDLQTEKSLSLKLKIHWENMTNQDINDVMNKAIQAVKKNWWKLR